MITLLMRKRITDCERSLLLAVFVAVALLGGGGPASPYGGASAFATTATTTSSSTHHQHHHLLPLRRHAPSLLYNRQGNHHHHHHYHYHYHNVVPSPSSTTTATTTTGLGGAAASWMAVPRGGAAAAMTPSSWWLAHRLSSPQKLFNATLAALAVVTVAAKLLQHQHQQRASAAASSSSSSSSSAAQQNGGAGSEKSADLTDKSSSSSQPKSSKPASVVSLQRRFLAVFWLLRCSDWLQGPYFYEVYASKVIGGVPASFALVSRLFLTGFASTALFGPVVGRAADQYGRKRATVAFTVLYALGAWSTKSLVLQVLLLGRVLSGIGTSLLFSAPESWLVAEAQSDRVDDTPDGKYLSETFGLAYAGDSIVAIVAGQMAAWAAARRGPTGPFELSSLVLVAGGLLTALLWGENKARRSSTATSDDGINDSSETASSSSSSSQSSHPSIHEAISVVRRDPKILLVGGVQSLFEAAMYIFVLQWPPAMAGAVQKMFPDAAAVPFGTIFSCFMACCLLGSTLFGQLAAEGVPTEKSTIAMLSTATAAMSVATWTIRQSALSLPLLATSFFAFEACVGMYFPSIGTLRSRYVPDSHRSVIMNLFGIPLNVLVVSVFLSIHKLGVGGALSVSSTALALATACMWRLRRITKEKNAIGIAS